MGVLDKFCEEYNIKLNTPFWIENDRQHKYVLDNRGNLLEYYTSNPYLTKIDESSIIRTYKNIFKFLDKLDKENLKIVYSIDECSCICQTSNLNINSMQLAHGYDGYTYFDFKKSELVTKKDDDSSVYYQKSMPIKYCPFCGRNLKEKNNA